MALGLTPKAKSTAVSRWFLREKMSCLGIISSQNAHFVQAWLDSG